MCFFGGFCSHGGFLSIWVVSELKGHKIEFEIELSNGGTRQECGSTQLGVEEDLVWVICRNPLVGMSACAHGRLVLAQNL